jgi:S1-C subfamily serine protease
MVKRKRTIMFATVILVVGLLIGAMTSTLAGVWQQAQAQEAGQNTLAALPAGPDYQPVTSELDTAALYDRVTQSVVNVSVIMGQTGAATGTGFVIDQAGHIVTNNHVVENATYIEATFVDGTTLEAELVGRDPDADLAVIRVDPSAITLQPATFADSDQAFVGQDVLAIGSPFGQDFTLTTGIVSGLNRSLRSENDFSIPELIQTDAAINPGNSGGPLLDRNGDVIGVNTAILSGSGSSSGIGFAIPSNTVRRIVPYLIENGKFEHSWLGIAGMDLLPAQREAMGLDSTFEGVIVTDVIANGPAAQAGLQSASSEIDTPLGQMPIDGDIITAINGEPVNGIIDLIAYLDSSTLPGDHVTLDVWRDGQTMQVDVTLQPRP